MWKQLLGESARQQLRRFKPLVLEINRLEAQFEDFSDDTSGEQDEVLDYRIVTGFSYSLLELFDVFFLTEATLLFEYRHSRYEKEEDSEATNSQNMYQVQLVFGF